MKPPASVPVPPGVVTATATAPAALPGAIGVVALIWVALSTTTPVAATPPNVTAVAPDKVVPVMVTAVPPAIGPALGATAPTPGAST